jgi:hypothetical protein
MQTDYKQIFDSGFEVAGSDCPHMRPINGPMPTDFKAVIENYYARALAFR